MLLFISLLNGYDSVVLRTVNKRGVAVVWCEVSFHTLYKDLGKYLPHGGLVGLDFRIDGKTSGIRRRKEESSRWVESFPVLRSDLQPLALAVASRPTVGRLVLCRVGLCRTDSVARLPCQYSNNDLEMDWHRSFWSKNNSVENVAPTVLLKREKNNTSRSLRMIRC